jgi:hypothetical protein
MPRGIPLGLSWDKTNTGAPGQDGPKGESKSTVYAYFYTGSETPPSPPSDETIGQWSFTDGGASPTYPYVYRSEGVKTVDSNGNTSYDNWQTPILYKAWHSNSSVSQISNAEVMRLTNFGTDGMYYAADGSLFINATYLKVLDGEKTVFEAPEGGRDGTTVKLAGWTASSNLLQSEDGAVGLYSGAGYTVNTGNKNSSVRFYAGSATISNAPFMVTSDGSLYAT